MTQSERRETLKQEFLKCYETVFNPDNSIRVCGRENCKKLIELAEELCPGVKKFGSKETGFINEEEIMKLRKAVSKEEKR